MDSDKDTTGASGLEKMGGLEKNIGLGSSIVDSQIANVVNQFGDFVCQVLHATPSGFTAVGTGFLIGPRHVLTNFHVVEGVDVKNLRCRFDVVSSVLSEFEAGPLLSVEKILAQSRYAEIEANGKYTPTSDQHPGAEELDYALLEIDSAVQNLAAKDGSGKRRRGWLPLPDKPQKLSNGTPIIILQHPDGATLKVASDAIAQRQPPNGSRLRYLADTDRGSSGSPCFAYVDGPDGKPQLALVALHNFGDPGTKLRSPEFNHGIPVDLIFKSLVNAGVPKSAFSRPVPAGWRPPWVALACGLAAVVALVVVIVLPRGNDPIIVPDPPDPPTGDEYSLAAPIPYDPDFLGKVRVPLPTLISAAAAGDVLDGQVLDYVHYSLVMDERRGMPLYVAYNTDRQNWIGVRREGEWRKDARIDEDLQKGGGVYRSNDWDRGHMARRTALTWGDTETARLAGLSSFYYTNSVPQHRNFNQGIWLDLEDYVFEGFSPSSPRVSVFTGPVHRWDDPEYRGARIPRSFWKIVVASDPKNPRNIFTAGFLLDQFEIMDGEPTPFPINMALDPAAAQVAIAEIEELTPLRFGILKDFEVELSPANPGSRELLDTYPAEKSAINVLALSWQPAFCERRPDKPECIALNNGETAHAEGQFSIHGLWPQPIGNFYCGVPERIQMSDRSGIWDGVPDVLLKFETYDQLVHLMPGTESGLYRHEWIKHGTCYGGTGGAEEYFADTIWATQEINGSAVKTLFADNIGQTLTEQEIRGAFDNAFGANAGERVAILCQGDGTRALISELRIHLGAVIDQETPMSDLLASHEPVQTRCQAGIVDPAGLQ